MEIEWEAKFLNVNKAKLRKKLKSSGAKLVKPEQLYKRVVFFLPKGHEIEGGRARRVSCRPFLYVPLAYCRRRTPE